MKKAEERKPAEKVSEELEEELEEEHGRHLMQEKKTALALHVKLPKLMTRMTPSSQLTKIQAEKEAAVNAAAASKSKAALGTASSSVSTCRSPSKDKWIEKMDPKSNKTYYLNERTGVSQWEKPDS